MRIFEGFDENTNDGGFERWTKRLLEHLGYVNVNTTKTTADEGIDLTAVDDTGFTCGIQCKNWEEDHKVSAKEIRDLIGAVSNKRLDKPMFFTTSSFSKKAKEAAVDGNVALYDWDSILDIVEETGFDEYEEEEETLSTDSVVFEHNKEFYNKVKEQLETNKKSLLILGTGLGKTTTALEYCREHQCNALIVCPKNVICDGWKKNPEIKKAITYQSFSAQYLELNYAKYGLVILDEVHHAGASVWGAGVKYLIDNGIPVLGLTATEKRLDGIDIKKEFFGENVVEGYTVLEGINAGILYPFTYVGAYYNSDEVCDAIKEKYGDKLDENLIGKLDTAKNNTPKVREIIRTDMPEGKRKGIIFVEDAKSIEEGIKLVKDVYPDLEYRVLYSSMPKNEKDENKEWFENADEGYLCSINMVSEGIHYSGVNTIFMLRRTSSPTVFEQQIGRVITLTSKKNPNAVIFDLVNNSKTVKNFKWKIKQSQNGRTGLSGLGGTGYINGTASFNTDGDKSKQIIVKEYVDSIDDVLEEIKNIQHINAEDAFPEMKALFDYEKNYPITLKEFSSYSNEKVFWKCNNGHSYLATIHNVARSIKQGYCGCQICANKKIVTGYNSFGDMFPEMAQYYCDKNLKSVYEIAPHAKDIVLWECPVCGETYKRSVDSQAKRKYNVCRKCSYRMRDYSGGRSFKRDYKCLVKYLYPGQIDVGAWAPADTKLYWVCPRCKKKYIRTIQGQNQSKTHMCGECTAKMKTIYKEEGELQKGQESFFVMYPELVRYVGKGVDIDAYYPVSKSISWVCKNCGSEYSRKIEDQKVSTCLCKNCYTKIANHKKSKKVKCVETGEVFNSVSEAAEHIGCTSSFISFACNGRAKSAYGFHWKYVEEETEENNLNQND